MLDYRNPDYTAVYVDRAERLKRIRDNPALVPALKHHYKNNIAQFLTDWACTVDPRGPEIGQPSVIPFILFPKQVEWVEWFINRWKGQEPGICDKSRDMGLSWLAVCTAASICLFNEGIVAGFGSRKEDYVDKIGDPKSLFWKAREFLKLLPVEFAGNWSDAHMRITFTDTGSVMTGEAGDNIGRGDRTSFYFVDEAQPYSERICTPNGWRLMGDLSVGDYVSGANGHATKITHIKECGIQDIYTVAFSDGTSTRCTTNHLWNVAMHGGRTRKTLRTVEMFDAGVKYYSPGKQTQYRFRTPMCSPIEFVAGDKLPLHPYIVGCLLGDGNLTNSSPRITSADEYIFTKIESLLPDGVKYGAFDGRYTYNIIDNEGRKKKQGGKVRSRMWQAIARAGLLRVTASFKNIPEIYLYSSIDDRLELLRGLMDTDGHAQSNGGAAFHTSSKELADGCAFLTRSLGGLAMQSIRGDARGYKDQYYVQVILPSNLCPFSLPRKVERMRRSQSLHRTIIRIEKTSSEKSRCITVDADDGLYITNDFIVTHNSAHIERPQLVDASLSATTNCRIDISSANGMANPFAQKRFSGKIPVFTMHWRDDPRKDDAWYEKKRNELDAITLAQEIDIDYSASVEGVLIPSEWVQAAIDADEKLDISPSGTRKGALDVADEGKDENAFAGRHGILLEHVESWKGIGSDIFGTVERAFMLCDEKGYQAFDYDADGLGAGVRGDARIINARRDEAKQGQIEVGAFRGSGAVLKPDAIQYSNRKNKDLFANAKAQAWWALRVRFQNTYRAVVEGVNPEDWDNIISISSRIKDLNKLKAELSQPTYSINNAGKFIIDKAPGEFKSPNLADSVMICFSDSAKSGIVKAKVENKRKHLVIGNSGGLGWMG